MVFSSENKFCALDDVSLARLRDIPYIEWSDLASSSVLGEGSFATVFKAMYQGNEVAVKVYNMPEADESDDSDSEDEDDESEDGDDLATCRTAASEDSQSEADDSEEESGASGSDGDVESGSEEEGESGEEKETKEDEESGDEETGSSESETEVQMKPEMKLDHGILPEERQKELLGDAIHELEIMMHIQKCFPVLYKDAHHPSRPTPKCYGYSFVADRNYIALVMSMEGDCIEKENEDWSAFFRESFIKTDMPVGAFFSSLLRAYQFFHLSGVVHRDAKSSSIHMLPSNDCYDGFRFIDFNLSALTSKWEDCMSDAATDAGTPGDNISFRMKDSKVKRRDAARNDLFGLVVLVLRYINKDRSPVTRFRDLGITKKNIDEDLFQKITLENAYISCDRDFLIEFIKIILIPVVEYRLDFEEADRLYKTIYPSHRSLPETQAMLAQLDRSNHLQVTDGQKRNAPPGTEPDAKRVCNGHVAVTLNIPE